jgi:hypothetical protein
MQGREVAGPVGGLTPLRLHPTENGSGAAGAALNK